MQIVIDCPAQLCSPQFALGKRGVADTQVRKTCVSAVLQEPRATHDFSHVTDRQEMPRPIVAG
jgi:hypothetical protein